MLAAAALSLASASYQLPHGALPAVARHRAPSPTLGFFEDMKKGFDAGMEGTKAPEGARKEAAKAPEGATAPAEPSFFDTVRKTLINAAPTAEERLEERKRRGEGVVWSADFSRVWMSTKGPPPCGNASPIRPARAGQSRPEPARAAQAPGWPRLVRARGSRARGSSLSYPNPNPNPNPNQACRAPWCWRRAYATEGSNPSLSATHATEPRLGQVRAAMGAAPIRAYLSAAERPLRRA